MLVTMPIPYKKMLIHSKQQCRWSQMGFLAHVLEIFKLWESIKYNAEELQFQIVLPLLELDQNRSKLKLYIGHLTALCQDRDPQILHGLSPPASYHLDDDRAAWEEELQKMTKDQLDEELERCERESADLQEFANAILQQIADHCPDILEQVVNALEESS